MSKIRLLMVIVTVSTIFAGIDQAYLLRKVAVPSHVCNAKNRDAGQALIPVKVGDKTYYGCCKLCTETLSKEQASRFATDPISGTTVDKATAIIAVKPDGAVLYFESEKSFREFSLK